MFTAIKLRGSEVDLYYSGRTDNLAQRTMERKLAKTTGNASADRQGSIKK